MKKILAALAITASLIPLACNDRPAAKPRNEIGKALVIQASR